MSDLGVHLYILASAVDCCGETDRQTNRLTHPYHCGETDRQTNRLTHLYNFGETDKQMDQLTHTAVGRQTDKQIDWLTCTKYMVPGSSERSTKLSLSWKQSEQGKTEQCPAIPMSTLHTINIHRVKQATLIPISHPHPQPTPLPLTDNTRPQNKQTNKNPPTHPQYKQQTIISTSCLYGYGA